MQRSSHDTNLFHQLFLHASIVIIAQYFCYAKIPARDRFVRPVMYMRQSLLLHIIFIMQRSLHETDSFDQLFLHASIIIIAPSFGYAKIPARDRLDQLCTCINHYYCTIFLLCKDPCTRQIRVAIYTHQSLLLHSILVSTVY